MYKRQDQTLPDPVSDEINKINRRIDELYALMGKKCKQICDDEDLSADADPKN